MYIRESREFLRNTIIIIFLINSIYVYLDIELIIKISLII